MIIIDLSQLIWDAIVFVHESTMYLSDDFFVQDSQVYDRVVKIFLKELLQIYEELQRLLNKQLSRLLVISIISHKM